MLVDGRTKLEKNNLLHCFKTSPLGVGYCDSCSGTLCWPAELIGPVPGPHPLSISRPVVVISGTLPRNCTTITAAKPSRSEMRSVSGLDQVICERLDRRCGVAGLRILTVVADENGLARLDNDDSCPSLSTMPQLAREVLACGSGSSRHRDRVMGGSTYLSAVNVAVCDVEGDISLALDIDALAQGLVHGGTGPVPGQDFGDGRYLLRF
jgi:hypothetical protein